MRARSSLATGRKGGSPVGRSLTCGSRARDRFGLGRAPDPSHPRRAGAKACGFVRCLGEEHCCAPVRQSHRVAASRSLAQSRRDRLQPRESRSEVVSERSDRRGCRAPVRCAVVEGSAVPRELSPQHVEYGKGAFRPAFTPQSIGACVPGKGARGVAWRALLRGGAASPPQVRCSAGTVADRRRSS